NKVKVVLRFRGREMSHQEIGKELLERFRDAVKEAGTVDKTPNLEGRLMTMIVNPVKK
ncbi:MAG: translation initiation factor IF-3, partial [Eubacteriales bacterium]